MRVSVLAAACGLMFTPAFSQTLVSNPLPASHIDIGTYKREVPQDMQIMQLFLPLGSTQRKNDLWFLDLRVQDREGPAFEGNVGLGYRAIQGSHEVGHYAYWDKRKTFAGNTFKQLVLGGEYQTQHTGWHGNMYLPLGKREALGTGGMAELRENGGFHNIWYANGYEHMLTGADLEYGWDVKPDCRLYLGGYAFRKGGIRTAIGPRVSVRWRPFHTSRLSNLTFDGLWRYDRLQRHTWHLGMTYRLWLGEHPKSDWSNVLVDTVRRDLDIVTNSRLSDFQPLKRGDGQVIKVKQASTASDLSASADLLYLTSDIELTTPVTLSDGEGISGTGYEFEVGGQHIQIGSGDARIYTNADIDLLTLTGTNTIQHVTLDIKPGTDHYALKTTGAFRADVHHITTNGRLNFSASTGTDNELRFHDNTVAFNPSSAPANSAIVNIEAPGASTMLTVHGFARNQLSSTTTGLRGWRNTASGDNSVILYEESTDHNIVNNTAQYSLENNTIGNSAAIDFAGPVSYNTLPGGVFNATNNLSEVGFTRFDHNTLSNMLYNSSRGGGTIAFSEKFDHNTLVSSTAFALINDAAANSDIVFSEMAYNTIQGSASNVWLNTVAQGGHLDFLGTIHNNTIRYPRNSIGGSAIKNYMASDNTVILFAKPVTQNTFANISTSGSFTAIENEIEGDGASVTFAGGISENTFDLKNTQDKILKTKIVSNTSHTTFPSMSVAGFHGNKVQKTGHFTPSSDLLDFEYDDHSTMTFNVGDGSKTVTQANTGFSSPKITVTTAPS